MMELNLYHVRIPALTHYLCMSGMIILMISFPFLNDLTNSIYCFFPFTSLLTWIVSGQHALIQGLIKVCLYFGIGWILMAHSHGLTMVLMMVYPLMVELLLYGFTSRMINIDELLVISSAMMIQIITRMVRQRKSL